MQHHVYVHCAATNCAYVLLSRPAGASIGMPDLHSGYGFAIGNVAAVDMDDLKAVVSPGGVGFDINCGVSQLYTCKTFCAPGGTVPAQTCAGAVSGCNQSVVADVAMLQYCW